jgi:hypothetical protein
VSIAQHTVARDPLSFGTVVAPDDTAAALTYEPLDVPAAASEWSEQERADFFEAEYRDSLRESGGGW